MPNPAVGVIDGLVGICMRPEDVAYLRACHLFYPIYPGVRVRVMPRSDTRLVHVVFDPDHAAQNPCREHEAHALMHEAADCYEAVLDLRDTQGRKPDLEWLLARCRPRPVGDAAIRIPGYKNWGP
jgi:hypothetical protein